MSIVLVARVRVMERLSLVGGMDNLHLCPYNVKHTYASGCLFLLTEKDMEYLETDTSLNIISLKQIRDSTCYFLGFVEPSSSACGNS